MAEAAVDLPAGTARSDEETSDEENAEFRSAYGSSRLGSLDGMPSPRAFSPSGKYSLHDDAPSELAEEAEELRGLSLSQRHHHLMMTERDEGSGSSGNGSHGSTVPVPGTSEEAHEATEGQSTPRDPEDPEGEGGDPGAPEAGAYGDDEGSEPGGSPGGNPMAIRDLDNGTDMQMFKVYVIHDSVSGAEWVVDGGVDPRMGWNEVWQEKRVKDAKTGRITSLAELEHELVERVLAQFNSHRVKDLDTGAEIDLFQGIPREAVVESVRKELIVSSCDSETEAMLSLNELQKLLVPASLQPRVEKKARRRRLKLKGKNVKRFAAKISTGLQAGMAGIQAGLQDRGHTAAAAAAAEHAGPSDPLGPASAGFADDLGHAVKVQVVKKQYKELSNLTVLQLLDAHEGRIWAMKFSRSGDHLASAGEDTVVRVWEVVKPHLRGVGSRKRYSDDGMAATSAAGGAPRGDEAPAKEASAAPEGDSGAPDQQQASGDAAAVEVREVVRNKPYRQFRGHTSTVLDLSWSASGFLLSSSMDKTVRLWHISVDGECLRVFHHTDFVTVVDFHPREDKHFISGSIDGKVRLWNLTSVRVVDFADCHEAVTAAAFSPEGDQVAVGTGVGKCRFYGYEGMKMSYAAQLDVCNKAVNKKVTGIQFQPGHPGKVLISSNDSRIRLYDTTEYQQICKYKGHLNRAAQIRASFSADGKNLVSGSDQGLVYVWSAVNPLGPAASALSHTGFRKDKNASYECFASNEEMVTVALFAPETTHDPKLPTFPQQEDPAGGVKSPLPPVPPPRPTGISCFAPGPGSVLDEHDGQEAHAGGGGLPQQKPDPGAEFGFSLDKEVLVAAGPAGDIKFFQNQGPPKWL